MVTAETATSNSWDISEFANFFDIDSQDYDGPSTSDPCNKKVCNHSISYGFNFDSFECRSKTWIESPPLKYRYKGDHQWRFIIYPNGNCPNDNRFISVYSKLERSKRPTVASFKLEIVDCDNVQIYRTFTTLPFVYFEGEAIGFTHFLRRDDLVEDSEFTSHSGLRLLCRINYEDDDRASWPYISSLDSSLE